MIPTNTEKSEPFYAQQVYIFNVSLSVFKIIQQTFGFKKRKSMGNNRANAPELLRYVNTSEFVQLQVLLWNALNILRLYSLLGRYVVLLIYFKAFNVWKSNTTKIAFNFAHIFCGMYIQTIQYWESVFNKL